MWSDFGDRPNLEKIQVKVDGEFWYDETLFTSKGEQEPCKPTFKAVADAGKAEIIFLFQKKKSSVSKKFLDPALSGWFKQDTVAVNIFTSLVKMREKILAHENVHLEILNRIAAVVTANTPKRVSVTGKATKEAAEASAMSDLTKLWDSRKNDAQAASSALNKKYDKETNHGSRLDPDAPGEIKPYSKLMDDNQADWEKNWKKYVDAHLKKEYRYTDFTK